MPSAFIRWLTLAPIAVKFRTTTGRAKSIASTNTGKLVPSRGTIFSPPTTITSFLVTPATTFRGDRFPPPPLMRLSLGSTSSAPSMVMSRASIFSRVESGIPASRGFFGEDAGGHGDDRKPPSAHPRAEPGTNASAARPEPSPTRSPLLIISAAMAPIFSNCSGEAAAIIASDDKANPHPTRAAGIPLAGRARRPAGAATSLPPR